MSTIGDDDIEVDENAGLDDENFGENAHSVCRFALLDNLLY
jgi:hypothetical protein